MEFYPEKLPNTKPIKRFIFDLESSMQAKEEIDNQIFTIEERIDKIIQHFTIDDLPIIRIILNMTHDNETLKGLSKALARVADLVQILDNLSSKQKIIEHAQTDVNWFASTFGDFTSTLDKDLEDLLGDNND